MASYYSVVRFVPSALAEEFVNIGVLTFDDGDDRVRGKFLEDWHRVEKFAALVADVRQARAFQEWVLESMIHGAPTYSGLKPLTAAHLRHISSEWTGSLRLTPPRASMLDADSLLEDLAPTFLIEPPPRLDRVADKRQVVRKTTTILRASLKKHIGDGKHLIVQTRHPLVAAVRPRLFDIVIANGSPRYAVQCFDFNVADTKRLLEQVDATAFAVEDVHKKTKNLPVSVVATHPEQDPEGAYDQALATFKQVGVTMVQESDVDTWAESVASDLAAEG